MATLAHTIDIAKLTTYLEQQLAGFQGPVTVEKFSGGQSNPTFLLKAGNGRYVLRRKPEGALLKSAHAIDREFKVMSALAGTAVPVAKTYHLCTDERVLGTMFYLMEYIDGRVFWDPKLSELNSNEHRAAIYDAMNNVLVALHSIDVVAVGLSDYGHPGNYFERQISRWITQYKLSETESYVDMDELIAWLPNNTPDDDGRISLVHGDFRLDNMLFAHDSAQVLALVDWELSTLGHPFADLAYQCMQWRMSSSGEISGLGDVDRTAWGLPSEQAYVQSYCQRMGISKIANWNFYIAFSAFRFAAILQGVKKRAIDGNASSSKADKMGQMVAPLAKMAVALL